MKLRFSIPLIAGLITGLSACSSWRDPALTSDSCPEIFPDYKECTVPANIAPLNFMVEGAGRVQARLSCADTEIRLSAEGEDVMIPQKEWKRLLSSGGTVKVEVSAWTDECPYGVAYRPFNIYVADEEIDPYVAYRLIEPGYVGWRHLGIYQRCLESFEESAVVTNRKTNSTCLNCHNFPAYSSESMMFHARGANGGTILWHGGKTSKIDFSGDSPVRSVTYPSWHPGGRYIAFSSNTTHQVFFDEGQQPVEVFDTASDLVVYDIHEGTVIADGRFMTEESLETFPSWSPDGRRLYFASYHAKQLPVRLSSEMRYDLLSVGFDPETGSFDAQVDTVYDSALRGGSVSYPRVSRDGRYMLYTWSEYGTFPIWHQEADLRMIDLESGEDVDVSAWNDPSQADSYHSWSSNGRWVVFGSRRLDGRYTRLYIAYLDKEGKARKPFLMPQKDPEHDILRLKSYNVPELIDGKVVLPKEASELFYTEE